MRAARAVLWLSALCLATAPATADVSGRVFSVDGTPIARARVDAYAQETVGERATRLVEGRARIAIARGESRVDGSFRLATSAAVVDLALRAEGYAPWFQTSDGRDPVTATLQRAEWLSGVLRAGGKPVGGATLVWDDGGGAADFSATSREDGSYQVPDPRRWAARVQVFHPDFAPPGPDETPRPDLLPIGLDVGVAIQGRVVDRESKGVPGATVWVGGWPLARSSRDGSFRIAHAPSAWQAVVARTRTRVGVARPAPGAVVVELAPARSLSGAVRQQGTWRAIAGAVVRVASDDGDEATAISDAQGRFLVPRSCHPGTTPSSRPPDTRRAAPARVPTDASTCAGDRGGATSPSSACVAWWDESGTRAAGRSRAPWSS